MPGLRRKCSERCSFLLHPQTIAAHAPAEETEAAAPEEEPEKEAEVPEEE